MIMLSKGGRKPGGKTPEKSGHWDQNPTLSKGDDTLEGKPRKHLATGTKTRS